MNARLGHLKSSVSSEDKVFVREHFIAPQISMINFFLTKVCLLKTNFKDDFKS
jgi:hypothetical protein